MATLTCRAEIRRDPSGGQEGNAFWIGCEDSFMIVCVDPKDLAEYVRAVEHGGTVQITIETGT